jgi:head-tail adaptor
MHNMMKKCSLLTKTTSYDAYNKGTSTWTHSKYIFALISVRAGSTTVTNNLVATTSTHIALTISRDVTVNDRLSVNGTTYIIDYVIQGERNIFTQLFLKVV